MMNGYHSLAFGFDEEPGEYRWVLQRINNTDMCLQILEFDDLWSNLPSSAGKKLLEVQLPIAAYASAVALAAKELLAKHGEEEYEGKWIEHRFPTATLDLLDKALARYS